MKTSPTINKIALAVLNAQKEMEAVTKSDDNPFFNSKYADINKFLEVAKKELHKQGVLLLQPTGPDNSVFTILIHPESGEFLESDPLKLILSKQDMQNVGSCITYARRFSLQSMLSMQAEDDDGETAVGRGRPTYTKKEEVKAPVVAKASVVAPSPKIDNTPIVTKNSPEPDVDMPKVETKAPVAPPVENKPKPKFQKPSANNTPKW